MKRCSNPKQWVVYLLQCSDSSLYCGITNNLSKRLDVHNKGKGARYTRSRLPVTLSWSEEMLNRSEASKEEARIKKLKRTDKIKLIDS